MEEAGMYIYIKCCGKKGKTGLVRSMRTCGKPKKALEVEANAT